MLHTPHFERLTWQSGCELIEFLPLDYTYNKTSGDCRAQCHDTTVLRTCLSPRLLHA
jgi:hypothetical protein